MTTTTPITTPFSVQTTAAEVVAGIDLRGSRIIVTGAASGIGVETARAFASTGAEVTLAVRNAETRQCVASEIAAAIGNRHVLVAPLDLAERASIDSFVAEWDGPLDVLVNNAGVMACPETRTPQGVELQFATNHLGHFALATGLHHALAAAGGARIVSVSSRAHLRSPVMFEYIHFLNRGYDPWDAYAQSKTANVLFAVETRRGAGQTTASPPMHYSPARFGRTCSGTSPMRTWSKCGRVLKARTENSAGRRPSRGRRPRFYSRPHRSLAGSAGATSRTATKQHPPSPAPVAASPRTRSTRRRRHCSGNCPPTFWRPDRNQ
ncbi:MAG: short-chain dehydrogenase/reductase [Mycobacterium sp.]|nr:short-chain dehydrogenase/reductase [Mycobacterium sp.]